MNPIRPFLLVLGIGFASIIGTCGSAQDAVANRESDGKTGKASASQDFLKVQQRVAIESETACWGYWGDRPSQYSSWTSHSNRLIPVYTFGVGLDRYRGENSVYRDEEKLRALYGRLPEFTLNPEADYFDQTDIYHMMKRAANDGKKYIFLVVFDGMDWNNSRAAAICASRSTSYSSGRGTGLHFLDYRTDVMDFGLVVTSPHNTGTTVQVDAQVVTNPGGTAMGGYSVQHGGSTPWSRVAIPEYLLGKLRSVPHVVTDSASSATSFNSGIKTFNGSVNIAYDGAPVQPLAQTLQTEKDFAIGVVTSVPITHATPACVYANNVTRNDYQDLTRDMLGLASVSHRDNPLQGVDVLIGCGWGVDNTQDANQGQNFVPGNKYITKHDLKKIDTVHGGKYKIVQRTSGQPGAVNLNRAAKQAIRQNQRLFGFFGGVGGHLPYQTADGGFDPTRGVNAAESYSSADISENPSLAAMTDAAIDVLAATQRNFFLMVEPGDVDWAAHNNNIDDMVGAVKSGDHAVRVVTQWIDANNAWADSVLIITADHGHYLNLIDPDILLQPDVPRGQPRHAETGK